MSLIAVVDTETTGTDPKQDHVIEAAWAIVDVDTAKVVRIQSVLMHGETNPAEAINGIAPSLLRLGESIAMVDLGKVDAVVAHNAEFDMQMLRQEIDRVNVLYPQGQVKMMKPELLVCTCKLSSYMSTEKGHKLGEVAERYKVKQNGAHRAVADAETCGRILRAMVEGGKLPADKAGMLELTKRAEVSWKSRFRR